jgi:outer membrane autotransporter protein
LVRGVRAGFDGMQNAALNRTESLRRNLAATEHAIPYEAYLLTNTNAPAGARGPGDHNTIFGMHFWAQQFSGQGNFDSDGMSDGFDLNYYGTTFGLDRLFGEALVAGINYTYARSDATTTNGDDADTETYWLSLYGEWVSENGFFANALFGLGWSDYETVRIGDNYRGHGSYEGLNYGGHVDIGNYFHHNNWALAPYAGLHYLYVETDSYTETEEHGNQLMVDALEVDSLESAIGLKLRNRFDTRYGRFQTTGYVEWMYDFINEDIEATISDQTTTIKTDHITPEASLFNAGLGLGWIFTDNLELGIGYDGRFNENFEEHMGSAKITVLF